MDLHFHGSQIKRRTPDWFAAILSGAIAATVLASTALSVIIAYGGSLWGAISMIAAIVMGDGVFVATDSQSIAVLVMALTVHFALAIGFSLVLAAVIEACNLRSNFFVMLSVGTLFGAFIYLVDFYVMTVRFTWFVETRNWINFALHILYGMVTAIGYVEIAACRRTQRVRPAA